MGILAGGVAHDFNNLLTAITGYGNFLLNKLGDDSPLRREAKEISKAAERAAELAEAGLGQVIASLDAPTAVLHDRYRRLDGLFDRLEVDALGVVRRPTPSRRESMCRQEVGGPAGGAI